MQVGWHCSSSVLTVQVGWHCSSSFLTVQVCWHYSSREGADTDWQCFQGGHGGGGGRASEYSKVIVYKMGWPGAIFHTPRPAC